MVEIKRELFTLEMNTSISREGKETDMGESQGLMGYDIIFHT